ncbi:phosphate uptake regulator PhoU [Candidatus Woesearchaeota archaeon]|nr:phosphate uptake regulator PhoU [Candidatus Woesearchaeota archaeon]
MREEMKRKVARIGPSTLMISLPSKWCKERDLHKGDEIEVSAGENNGLVIGASLPEKKLKEITIDLSKFRYYPRHLITTAYKAGYDKIIAKYSSEKEKRDVENVLAYTCLGYSILEETKDRLVIKDLAETNEKEFEPVLRRVFYLATEIANNALEFAKTGNREKLAELISNRRTFHKNGDFCRRIINKNLPIGYNYLGNIFQIIKQLETITWAYQSFALSLTGIGAEVISLPIGFSLSQKIKMKKIEPKVIFLLEKINWQVALLPSLFYTPTLEKVNEYYHDTIKLVQEFREKSLSCKNGEEALSWSYIFLILTSLRDLRGALLSLNF